MLFSNLPFSVCIFIYFVLFSLIVEKVLNEGLIIKTLLVRVSLLPAEFILELKSFHVRPNEFIALVH